MACFYQSDPQARGMTLRVCDLDGVVDHVSATRADHAPVYLAWSADGRFIATLSQRDDDLELASYLADDLSYQATLATGSPLFFTWADDRVAAYVGQDDGAVGEMLMLDPMGVARPWPRRHPAQLLRTGVAQRRGHLRRRHTGRLQMVRSPTSGEVEQVEAVEGLVALVASPTDVTWHAPWHAKATAAPTPISPSSTYSPAPGRPFVRAPSCISLDPDGGHLVVASVDTERNLLRWYRQDLDGHRVELAAMRPTRELAFYLRFFEQYASTHPIIDPNGQAIIVGGELADTVSSHSDPTLWWLPLDGSEPTALCQGVFAVFPTHRSSASLAVMTPRRERLRDALHVSLHQVRPYAPRLTDAEIPPRSKPHRRLWRTACRDGDPVDGHG